MKPLIWEHCYDVGWKGFITPDSFTHPAKYARGLIERIFDHCLARGYLKRGDCVGDCFGGIGTGGIIASYRGLEWQGVELEPKFVALAESSFALHHSKLDAMGLPWPRIIQGDSRAFHVLIGETDGMVSSPPYAQTAVEKNSKGVDLEKNFRTYKASGGGSDFNGYKATQEKHSQGYGSREGQIAALKEGSVQGVISSPPYAVISTGAGGLNTKPAKHAGQQSGRSAEAASQDTDQKYGQQAGQIAALKEGSVEAVVSSPPYADTPTTAGNVGNATNKNWGTGKRIGSAAEEYGSAPGQIGALKSGEVSAVVTSPPWESNSEGVKKASKFKNPEAFTGNGKGHYASPAAKLAAMKREDERDTYGESEGQIGKESGETYWAAMNLVYRSCFKAIKPGGVICLVLKDYVKAGKRVPLCDDTVRLIEHIGFTMIERVHAMLVKETEHADLFNGHTTTIKSKKSFFRRLHEKKPNAIKIDWEEVLFARRPL